MPRDSEYGTTYAAQYEENPEREEFLARMQENFPPEKTVLAGNAMVQAQFRADMPFLDGTEYQAKERASEEDVAGRKVMGVLPMQLGAEAESVTEYVVDSTLQDRERRGDGFTQQQIADRADTLVTYRIHRADIAPEDFSPENTVVVTRHPELVEHLENLGIISPPGDDGERNFPVIEHVTDASEVDGKHIIGYLGGAYKFMAQTVTQAVYDRDSNSYGKPETFATEMLELDQVIR